MKSITAVFLLCAILLLAGNTKTLNAQPLSGGNSINTIVPHMNGLYFTDAGSHTIYDFREGELKILTQSPGAGNYFTLSPDGKYIGYKLIGPDRRQSPALLNLSDGSILSLHSSVERCGQISFADDGTTAFSIDETIVIYKSGTTRRFNIGNYANLTPLSPDARFCAYNDSHDRLWILDLETGEKKKITVDGKTFFHPQWSYDSQKLLYSGLNGSVYVYSLKDEKQYTFGKGYSPRWSPDSHNIVFYRKEAEKHTLLNTELFIADFRAEGISQLTFTENTMEVNPFFTDNGTLIYLNNSNNDLISSTLNENRSSLKNQKVLFQIPAGEMQVFNASQYFQNNSPENTTQLDIQYLHQVYDTPNWYNGHWACGPTTSAMLLAYYRILPIWETYCYNPNSHYSYWGRYICDVYQFREHTYNSSANDPNGTPSQGIYGYMWSTGSPHSRMEGFYNKNYISAETHDYPSHSFVVSEIQSQNPYSLCNGLTSAGHIVLAHGIGSESHTIITNDPYGDKNTAGYPSYDGKNAAYDWPGYNNGFQNFNTVYWGVTSRYTRPEFSDTLIDDLHFAEGFFLKTKSPSNMIFYRDRNLGYNDHFWWTPTRLSTDGTDTAYATWTPTLPRTGRYEIFVYIPFSETEDAQYEIHHMNGITTVSLNQKAFTNEWASLGMFSFEAGNAGYLQLGDGSSVGNKPLIFDAAYWTYIDSVTTAVENDGEKINPAAYSLRQNYPNPFNPITTISYSLKKDGFVTLKVYDVLGNETAVPVYEFKRAGHYTISFDASELASGIYFYTLQSGKFIQTRKMLLLK